MIGNNCIRGNAHSRSEKKKTVGGGHGALKKGQETQRQLDKANGAGLYERNMMTVLGHRVANTASRRVETDKERIKPM